MRPLAAIGALNRWTVPSAALVKRGAPVSALTACSLLSSSAPTTQMIDSAPEPVVVAIGAPLPFRSAHQTVLTPGGEPAVTRSATSPLFALGHDLPLAGKARMVPEGVAITAGAVMTTPFATCGAART